MSSNEKQPRISPPCYRMPPEAIKCEIQGQPPLRPTVTCNPKLDQNNAYHEPKLNENNDKTKD